MNRPNIESALVEVIDRESRTGIRWGWPGHDRARVAIRRWSTFQRRNKSKHPTIDDRILDLAKGLQSHFEPDMPYTPLSEWLHLAQLLAALFVRIER